MQRGLTIVEIIIVVAVISILAAISITAYNGIQERAYQAKRDVAVRDYEKIMKLYNAQYASFPPVTNWMSCLGDESHYPA